MQTIQTVFKDSITKRVFIGKPKIVYNQIESEKGIAMCSKNLKKVIVPTTQQYLHKLMEMYSVTTAEMGCIYTLLCYVSQFNFLIIDKMPLNTVRFAQDTGVSVKTAERMFRSLIKKKVLRKINKKGMVLYMINPIYGCFRNNIPYETYYVFKKEVDDFLKATGQSFRIDNIEGYMEQRINDIEREIRIL